MVRWRQLALCLLAVLAGAALWGQDSFPRGEELFLQNRPQEALPFLQAAIIEDPSRVQAFSYLGIAFQQLERLDEAIAVYRQILPRAGNETARIAYNLGNVYYAKGDAGSARQYYTQSIEADPGYASAYLNRANALVQEGELTEAIPDYELYLTLEPRSAKRPRIEQLIAFIREEFAEAERRRLVAEEQARQEAERKQRLLEEVSASLQSAADEIKGVSAGTEEVQGYEGEFELE
jgi:tetratricopeptide (TPR) repeat protein